MTKKATNIQRLSRLTPNLQNRSRLEKRETTEVIAQLVDIQRKMKKDKEKDRNNYDSEESENGDDPDGK